MPKEERDLKLAVAEWLAREGYRLEYQTQKAFNDVGIDAGLSHFVDSAEGKPREIDVSVTHAVSSPHHFIIQVFCECKYSTDKPWILMYSGMGSHFFNDWLNLPKSTALQRVTEHVSEHVAELGGCWHFAKGQPLAHTLLQAFGNEKHDVAYDSLQKIANAAWHSVEANESEDPGANLLTIPCLIVEGSLFGAHFDHESNEFLVKEIPFGRLSWEGCRNGTAVDVVNLSSVAEYAARIKQTLTVLSSVLNKMLE